MSTSKPESSSHFAAALMRPINALVERYIPSALVFVIVLTAMVIVLAITLTGASPVDVIRDWGNGLSGLLAFMTQMALILLLGHTLANTRPVKALLKNLASIPTTSIQAYVFVCVIAAFASLITWGLGLVVGGLLAREVAGQMRDKGVRMHFPMLVAAGYSGYVVWHMGYSGSGPLTAATEGSFLAVHMGTTIPLSATTFSSWNMIAALVTIVVVALALALVAPRDNGNIVELKVDARDKSTETEDEIISPADRLDASRLLTSLVGITLLAYLVIHFMDGGSLTLNIVNWSFLALIFLLVRNSFEMLALIKNAASNVGDILLQFPLYAGILGIMVGSGLIGVFSSFFVNISTPETFGFLAMLASGIVNFFVPSGGGQFAVQGPIMLDAAAQLGVNPAVAIMAVAYGDQWSNMIQPFWALPLLAIAGLKMRDILGYTTVTFLASGLVFGVTLLLVGAG